MKYSTYVLLVLLILFSGCTNSSYDCSKGSGYASGTGGESGFNLAIITRDAPKDRRIGTLECVSVTVFDITSYADTLAFNSVKLVDGMIRVRQLPEAEVDIVIHHRGYFPVKYTGIQLSAQKKLLDDRLILFPSDAPVTLPGQFMVQLKAGATLGNIESVYSVFDGVDVLEEPDGYHFQITSFDDITTRTDGERMAVALAKSRFVEHISAVTSF